MTRKAIIVTILACVLVLLAGVYTHFFFKPSSQATIPAATASSTPNTSATTTNDVMLGVYVGGSDPSRFTDLEQASGKPIAIENQGESFGSDWGTDDQRAGDEPAELAAGVVPMISLKLDGGQNNTCVQLQDLTSGKYDQDWTTGNGQKRPGLITLAQRFASWKVPVMIRFFKEFTDDQIDPCVYGTRSPTADPQKYGPGFTAAWKHVVDVFKKNGATNVQWVWGPSQSLFTTKSGAPDDTTWRYFYPGDAYVDWIGGDNYNKSGTDVKDWDKDPNVIGWYAIASKIGKPLMQSETGAGYNASLNPDPQTEWITSAYNVMKTEFPAIKAFVYWDDTGQADYVIQGDGLAAWKTMANDPYFEAPASAANQYFSSTGG